METRKLQEVGGGTYTVSIPKAWARRLGLEAGTPVHLYTHLDGSVVVRSRATDGGQLDATRVELAVDRDGRDDSAVVTRTLRAALAVGFDRVTLAREGSFTDAERRAVAAAVRELVGVEVVDEREGELVVRSLLDASDVSVRQSVVQLSFVARSMLREATAVLLDGDRDGPADTVDRLREREAEAERLSGMVARHFNRALVSLAEVDRLGTTRPELRDYCDTARHLRAVAREAVAVASTTERRSEPLSEELVDDVRAVADGASGVVEAAANAVLDDGDLDTVRRALADRDETRERIDTLDRALTDGGGTHTVSDAVATARALDAYGRTLQHGAATADVAIRTLARTDRL